MRGKELGAPTVAFRAVLCGLRVCAAREEGRGSSTPSKGRLVGVACVWVRVELVHLLRLPQPHPRNSAKLTTSTIRFVMDFRSRIHGFPAKLHFYCPRVDGQPIVFSPSVVCSGLIATG